MFEITKTVALLKWKDKFWAIKEILRGRVIGVMCFVPPKDFYTIEESEG